MSTLNWFLAASVLKQIRAESPLIKRLKSTPDPEERRRTVTAEGEADSPPGLAALVAETIQMSHEPPVLRWTAWSWPPSWKLRCRTFRDTGDGFAIIPDDGHGSSAVVFDWPKDVRSEAGVDTDDISTLCESDVSFGNSLMCAVDDLVYDDRSTVEEEIQKPGIGSPERVDVMRLIRKRYKERAPNAPDLPENMTASLSGHLATIQSGFRTNPQGGLHLDLGWLLETESVLPSTGSSDENEGSAGILLRDWPGCYP
jgi:hypothetical protein